MAVSARFVHVNLIAADWKRLSQFYQDVFGCVPVPPIREFAGKDLEAGTGIKGAQLQGVHLRLPGHDEPGPILEIFTYNPQEQAVGTAVNRPGFAHIAFEVENVPVAREQVIGGGGGSVGDIVTLEIATGAKVTWCYLTDPEGNIVELQSWDKPRTVV